MSKRQISEKEVKFVGFNAGNCMVSWDEPNGSVSKNENILTLTRKNGPYDTIAFNGWGFRNELYNGSKFDDAMGIKFFVYHEHDNLRLSQHGISLGANDKWFRNKTSFQISGGSVQEVIIPFSDITLWGAEDTDAITFADFLSINQNFDIAFSFDSAEMFRMEMSDWYFVFPEGYVAVDVDNENSYISKITIEDYIIEYLDGELQEKALEFLTYINENQFPLKMPGYTQRYAKFSFNEYYLGWIGVPEKNKWYVEIFNFSNFVGLDGEDEEFIATVHKHINPCSHSCCGSCPEPCQIAKEGMTVFGKKFCNVCFQHTHGFENPDDKTIGYIKKLIEYRKNVVPQEYIYHCNNL